LRSSLGFPRDAVAANPESWILRKGSWRLSGDEAISSYGSLRHDETTHGKYCMDKAKVLGKGDMAGTTRFSGHQVSSSQT
jgi:hypothetical protein